MLDIVSKYYGLDLIATFITFLGTYYLGNQKRYGFLIILSGNVVWLAFGIWAQSLGIIIANIGLGALNIRGYQKWKKERIL